MDAILTFHSIDSGGSALSYPPGELERLFGCFLEHEVRVVPVGDILRPASDGENRVALTFDDGLRSFRRQALPILERFRFPATVYVVSSWVGRSNRWPSQPAGAPEFPLMDWDELRELPHAGVEVGAHGANHAPLRRLGEDEWKEEIEGCRDRIQDELQVAVKHFAYPYGTWSPQAERRVGRAFRTAVTTRMRFVREGDPSLRLPRIDAYYLRGAWSRSPLFVARTRRHLAFRAFLRRFRRGPGV